MNYFSNLFIGRKQNVVQATGYLDTGNTLKDISTGKHVVIASPEIMYDLLPLQLHALVYDYTNGIQPFDRKSSIYMPEGIHLIPYRTISSESDLMLAFDCKKVPDELLPYVGLLSSVLGLMDTHKHTYPELTNEININSGGIATDAAIYTDSKDFSKYTVMYEVKGKVLYEKLRHNQR
mgnify:CR=1 FL=1